MTQPCLDLLRSSIHVNNMGFINVTRQGSHPGTRQELSLVGWESAFPRWQLWKGGRGRSRESISHELWCRGTAEQQWRKEAGGRTCDY